MYLPNPGSKALALGSDGRAEAEDVRGRRKGPSSCAERSRSALPVQAAAAGVAVTRPVPTRIRIPKLAQARVALSGRGGVSMAASGKETRWQCLDAAWKGEGRGAWMRKEGWEELRKIVETFTVNGSQEARAAARGCVSQQWRRRRRGPFVRTRHSSSSRVAAAVVEAAVGAS
jgi:hypothetical protein